MSARRLDAVLLDLDGTVLDTHALILASWRHVREVFGLAERGVDDDAFRRGMGRPLREVLGAFARSDDEAERMVAAYRAHNDTIHDAMVAPFPRIPEALDALRRAGVALGIVTSKSSAFAARGLAVTGLRVDTLVGPTDARRPKPAPDPVLLALARLGVAPDRAVMIGDSPHDLMSGASAGVRTAAVAWGAFSVEELACCGPHDVLTTPDEIPPLALEVA